MVPSVSARRVRRVPLHTTSTDILGLVSSCGRYEGPSSFPPGLILRKTPTEGGSPTSPVVVHPYNVHSVVSDFSVEMR